MYRILNGIGIALLLLLMAGGVFIYMAPHFGWRVETVRSSSMSPEIDRGTLVVARPVESEAIAVGDIIIFRPASVGENLICHRVIGIERNSPLQFRTKGDAQGIPDAFLVPERNVVGRVIYHAHILGYALLFSKTPVGFVLTLVIPGIVVTAMCLRNIWEELFWKKRKLRIEVR